MHGWKRNPKAPSSLWDGLVLDGAYACLHPGTNRFVDGSGLENHGTLTNMDAATDWVWNDETGWSTNHATTKHVLMPSPSELFPTLPASMSLWVRQDYAPTGTADRTGIFRSNSAGVASASYHAGVMIYTDVGAVVNVLIGSGTGGSPSNRRSSQTANSLPIGEWLRLTVRVRSHLDMDIWFGSEQQSVTTSGSGSIYGVGTGGATIGMCRIDATFYNHVGRLASSLAWLRNIATAEISWLADRSNRMYVPDTRRAIWVPTPFNPALMRRRRRMAGAR